MANERSLIDITLESHTVRTTLVFLIQSSIRL